ncbi:DUF6349 family protein [Streptosporangium sp. NPDC049248]|uniref:DUF6349 family protein n=1 Tax=Streptosporangium sp. NPDC049248 TaxID=3155651 RepID=UPI00344736CA
MSGEPRGAVARHILWQQTPRDDRDGLWCIYINHPGYRNGSAAPVTSTAPEHRPTVLFLGSRSHALKRGACLGCDWEGLDRRTDREAVEDAHDHAWPAWRNLPAVLPPPGAADYDPEVLARWRAKVDRAYPPGWLAAGGPIVVIRTDPAFARHQPGKAPGGGYDLAATYFRAKKVRSNYLQPTLLEFSE